MYADKVTDAMRTAIDETNRRRKKQTDYNTANGIEPFTVVKAVHDLTERLSSSAAVAEARGEYKAGEEPPRMPIKDLKRLIVELEKEMKQAAGQLQFEQAAVIRDRIIELKMHLAEESDIPPWRKARLMAGEIE